jgi:acyl carrier protein
VNASIRKAISEELCIALSTIDDNATLESLGADSLDATNLGASLDADITLTDTVNTIAQKL